MPHYGVLYLLFYGAILLVGAPLVLAAQAVFGPNEGRDQAIWTVVGVGGIAAVVAVAS
jgi:hypothetical protein